jgi:putative two-component system response regulator
MTTLNQFRSNSALEPNLSGFMNEDVHSCKILMIDDVAVNSKVVKAYLAHEGFENFTSLTDSMQAVAAIYREDPDILLLDLMMPEVSGLEILAALRADAQYARLPILILTSAESRDLRSEALRLGATDFLSKPVDSDDLVPRVRNALLSKIYQDTLESKVRERTRDLERSRLEIIHCLARAAEYRDNETGRHVIRVSKYVAIIAEELGFKGEPLSLIEQASTLHDVGKIGIPDAILLKPEKLTTEEFETMQKHCGFGKKIFETFPVDEVERLRQHTHFGGTILDGCSSPVIELARSIALTHHEKWDGSGYPLGLAGEQIPLEGRITAVADVFDALSSKRPYKPAFPLAKCISILEEGRAKHFDPRVLDAFFSRQSEIVNIQIRFAEVD